MNNHSLSAPLSSRSPGALKIAGIYLLFGGLWILFSDQLAALITSDSALLTKISIYKGWGFILVTAMLLYWLLRGQSRLVRGGEEQLRLITDALPALISYVSADRHYRFNNQAYRDWFGSVASGRHMRDVLGTAAYERVSAYVDRVLAGETVSYETQVPYKDGGNRFVHATYVPDRSQNGHVRGFFALVHDVTENKRAEEERRRWADAFDGCSHGIAIVDSSANRIEVCNPAFAGLQKGRVEDVVGTSFLGLYAPTEHEQVRRSIEKADQIGHSRFEASMMRRDGSTFPVQMDVLSVLGDRGGLLYRVATAVDITARKEAEQALRESEERYRLIFELTNDYAYEDRVEADGQIIPEWITSGVTRITGYTIEEMYSPEFWLRLVHPEDVGILAQHVENILGGHAHTAEVRILTKNGEMRWLEDSAHPIWDSDEGRVKRFYGAALDITERKQAEEALKHSQERLHAIFEQSPISIQVFSPDGTSLQANRAWENLWGSRREQLEGYNILKDPQVRARGLLPYIERAFDGELVVIPPVYYDPAEIGQQGKARWTRAVVYPVKDAAGRIQEVVLTHEDITERKAAEEAVRESEEHLRQILDTALDAVIGMDSAGSITHWNAQAEAVFGWTLAEVQGRSLAETIIPPNLRAEHRRGLRRFHETGEGPVLNERIEVTGLRRNGETFPVELAITPLKGAAGHTFNAFLRDITDRKQSEEALRASEERYRIVFELTNDYAYEDLVEPDGQIVHQWVTSGVTRITGYTIDEMSMPGAWARAVHPDDLPIWAHHVERILSGRPDTAEARIVTKDGEIRWLRYIAHPIWDEEQQRVTRLYGAAVDITDHKQAAETIRSKDALLRMTSEMAQVGGWEFDTETHQGTWTDEVARIHDLDPAEQTNVQLGLSFYTGKSRELIERAVQDAIELGKPYDLELELISANGRHKWIRTMAHPITRDGRVIKVQGIFQDVTARKQTEEEIRQLNEKLEQRVIERTLQLQSANKELEAFSYSVSHDLRAPLRAIDGFTRILLEDYAPVLDDEGRRVCTVISKEAQHMGQLIDDLLTFSRLGRKEMHAARINMKDLVSSVYNELMRTENTDRVDFHVSRLPAVMGDVTLIRQVWVNLLSNAIKFSGRKERAVIEVGSKHNDADNVYFVRDNGAGFDMEYIDKLFGVFQRLHSEREFEGTGVGLAIVQQIVRRHGGRVWAEAEVDRGATFYFALPRKGNEHE